MLEHGTEFFNHLKNNCKESCIKAARFLLLCGRALSFNCELRHFFSQLKKKMLNFHTCTGESE